MARIPLLPLDLDPLPTTARFRWEASKKVEEIKDLHTKVRAKIERSTELAKL